MSRSKALAKDDVRQLTGPERSAILMLSLGEEHGQHVWKLMDDEEIKKISQVMSTLGTVSSALVEKLLVEFVSQMSATGSLMGSYESTERLISRFMAGDRVTQIKPEHAARVLGALPEEFALEVVQRMLRMESVQKDILDKVEKTLRVEFMSNLARTAKRDSHEHMAEIFNNFDRQTESRFLTALEERSRDSAERIKALMFTFEDLGKLDPGSIQTLLRHVEKDKLCLALKGATDTLRDVFFSNMSERAGKILREDMEAMGPVRLKDVDDAQMRMVNVAKDLANKGEIMIASKQGEDELIY